MAKEKKYKDMTELFEAFDEKGVDLVNVTTLCKASIGHAGCEFWEDKTSIHFFAIMWDGDIIVQVNANGKVNYLDNRFVYYVTPDKEDFAVFLKVPQNYE